MHSIIVSVLLTFIIGTYLYVNRRFPAALAFVAIPAIGLVSGFMFMLLGGVFLTDSSDFSKSVEKKKLISLDNNISSSGSFFLGSGNFEGTKKYFYYVQTEKGVISRSVYADRTYIEEFDSTGTPRIVEITYEPKPPKWYIPIQGETGLQDYKKIYIPEGSIKHQYKPN